MTGQQITPVTLLSGFLQVLLYYSERTISFNLLYMREIDEMTGKKVSKIVLTGGPCAGKTTGMSWIQNTFEKMGYTLIFMQEPATELKSAGITPARCSSLMSYQLYQMKLQLEKEAVYTRAARDIAEAGDGGGQGCQRKVLLVCDRGFFDNRAYMTAEEFQEALRILGVSEEEKLCSYDAVFHLETTAKNAKVYYGTATNAIRDETPEQAAALDDLVMAAWKEHPYHRVIENLSGFEDKMRHLVAEIAAFLGEPTPYEARRRFLVQYPDASLLEGFPDCYREEIEQTYLHAPRNEEIRLRKRKSGEDCVYYMTRTKTESGYRRLESEGRLTEREYMQFLGNADPGMRPIHKTRWSLTWRGHYYELDLYPFWSDRAVLEVLLRDEEEAAVIPDFLQVIREVTQDRDYEIASLASLQSKPALLDLD